MKVHLIKDGDVSLETFSEVIDLLQAIKGPIEFKYDNESVIDFDQDEVETKLFEKAELPIVIRMTHWDTIFDKCDFYRTKHNIANDEFVILLTDISNFNNWFASLDEKMPFNGFIHTADWKHYIKCNDAFPIAFEVVALILQNHMFNNYKEAQNQVHLDSIGCVNDMCMEKKDIKLKLRTADICQDCMEKLTGKLELGAIQQSLKIMESLRVKMLFSQNFKQNTPLSRLVIDQSGKIWLPEFGNIEIKLRPLEKALYFFYLNHPEGIRLRSLKNHKDEIKQFYNKRSKSDEVKNLKDRIDSMIDTNTDSAEQKISRIKSVFTKSIGNELAKHYYIKGDLGEVKKVDLLKELVIFNYL